MFNMQQLNERKTRNPRNIGMNGRLNAKNAFSMLHICSPMLTSYSRIRAYTPHMHVQIHDLTLSKRRSVVKRKVGLTASRVHLVFVGGFSSLPTGCFSIIAPKRESSDGNRQKAAGLKLGLFWRSAKAWFMFISLLPISS